MPTHAKGRNRDKYYNLAKEQGYRSRAAFKLIHLNKKHDFLSKARVCIDLCAAPGGWCQVAAKAMPANSVVLGVDLLPIRPIRNVKTLVSDITTAECRSLIKKEIPSGWQADVVLCDGAPNIGQAYAKDAYVQNELALAALKTATDHLGSGGTFVSKVYRSQDYNALLWVFKQLFDEVQAVKPSSSRQISAEIFIVCTGYKCPASLDPRLLDPAHVFRQIEVDQPDKKPSIFDKAYGVQKRHRTGYDDNLGQGMRRRNGVVDFVDCDDPGQFLADFDEIDLTPPLPPSNSASTSTDQASKAAADMAKLYLEHSSTSAEVKACLADLRVLNKGDFKTLLKWRLGLRAFKQELLKNLGPSSSAASALSGGGGKNGDSGDDEGAGSEDDDEAGGGAGDKSQAGYEARKWAAAAEGETDGAILAALEERQDAARMKVRREKKKERTAMAKLRERKALGMSHNSFEPAVDESTFSLKSLGKSRADLDAAAKVHLGSVSSDALTVEDDTKRVRRDVEIDEYDSDLDDEEKQAQLKAKIEGMMEESYIRYLRRRKPDDQTLRGTKAAKRSKKATALKAAAIANEDADTWDGDAYAKLLTGDASSDDGSSSDDDEVSDEEGTAAQKAKARAMLSTSSGRATAELAARKAGPLSTSSVRRKGGNVDDDDEEEEEKGNDDDDDDDEFEEDDEEEYHGDGLGAGARGGAGRQPKRPRTASSAAAAAAGGASSGGGGGGGGGGLLKPLPKTIEPASAAVNRWFSDPIFAAAEQQASRAQKAAQQQQQQQQAAATAQKAKQAKAQRGAAAAARGNGDDDSDDNSDDDDSDDLDKNRPLGEDGMPLTDKQVRSLRRKKNESRVARQKVRKSARLEQSGLEYVAGAGGVGGEHGEDDGASGLRVGGRSGGRGVNDDDDDDEASRAAEAEMTPEERVKAQAARAQIKAGLGITLGSSSDQAGAAVQYVPGAGSDAGDEGGDISALAAAAVSRSHGGLTAMPPRQDDRTYGSDEEEYDSEDEATTLALGTMMLRKSRAKKLVDASYNRYAWNDPSDLPEWFVDDEAKHYRPQLPVPKALMDSIKQRFTDLTTKPIKKVAEARARKRKRAGDKLKAAKKKAEALSQAPDLSEKEKLRAIGKTLSTASGGASATKKDKNGKPVYTPTKKLVVARKAMGGKLPKGQGKAKMVDKRQKHDTRVEKRAEQRKKNAGKKKVKRHSGGKHKG